VFGHGLGGSPSDWAPLVEAFGFGRQVLTFAQSGSAEADPSLFSARRHSSVLGFADDLGLLCGELGVRDAIFIGHSMGGSAGALAAAGDPGLFSKLVLINTSPCYVDDPDHGYRGGFSHADVDALLDAIVRDYDAWTGGFGPLVMSNPHRPEYGMDFVRALRALDPSYAAVSFRAAFTGDFRKIYPRIGNPTLLLQSRDDPAVPVDVMYWMAKAIPSADMVELQSRGHFPHVVDPGEVIRAAGAFVASPPGGRR